MNQTKFRSHSTSVDSFAISLFTCILIIFYFLQTSEKFFHWYLIPVTLSGVLIGIDAVEWFRGRLNIFDPVGIIGLLGFHFFFLAPLFHVSWDFWMDPYSPTLPEWRPWLGGMAILNLLGIIVYRFFKKVSAKKNKNFSAISIWQLNRERLPFVLPFFLIISAIIQIMVYRQFGGILNYIDTTASIFGEGEEAAQYQGMGIIYMLSETFPILAMIGFATHAQKNKKMQSWQMLSFVLLIFIVLAILFGGLRGSRSNTVWAAFWAVGIIHFWIRPVTKKQIAIGLAFMLMFMYFYGFLKSGGIEGFQNALANKEARSSLEAESGRTWQGLLLGDLGRSDLQALMLQRLTEPNSDYKYAWGRTYYSALTILIPRFIMPDKPFNKTKEGTELVFGAGSFVKLEFVYSKVYGLAGEAMLNFGYLAVPFFFIPFGVLVGTIQKWLYTFESSDTRLMLLPMLVNFCFSILSSDLDNDIFFIFKNGLIPFLVIVCISDKRKRLFESNVKK